MAKQIIARQQGDDYQAYFFWREALRLFSPDSPVCKAIYESEEVPYFDDVVIKYKNPIIDAFGNYITHDCYQVKYQVDIQKPLAHEALIDPQFIRAKTSILERVNKALENERKKDRWRFTLIHIKRIDGKDTVSELIKSNDGEFYLDKLFNDNVAKYRRVKKKWTAHLDCDDEYLEELLKHFRIKYSGFHLQDLIHLLNVQLNSLNLQTIDLKKRNNLYNSLIYELYREGKNSFSKEELTQILQKEGLQVQNDKSIEFKKVGLRTFTKGALHLEDDTDFLLCLIKYFDGRFIKEEVSWNDDLLPEINDFIENIIQAGEKVYIYLDTHTSLAYATGSILNSKSGIESYVIQKGFNGSEQIWSYQIDQLNRTYDLWGTTEIAVQPEGDLAVAISLTHNINKDVKNYIEQDSINVEKILHLEVEPEPSKFSIKDGNHAFKLAHMASSIIKRHKAQNASVHLFIAGPNAFTYYLGQHHLAIGEVHLYEFDPATSNYSYSLTLKPD